MRTKRIANGVYRLITDAGHPFILRLNYPTNGVGRPYWIAFGCYSPDEVSDDNSCCVRFSLKRELIEYLNK